MESWTRDVATAAGGTYSYDDAAFCLEGHKIKRRFADLPLCLRSRLLLASPILVLGPTYFSTGPTFLVLLSTFTLVLPIFWSLDFV
jgi:hypothetical protein